MIIAPTMSRTQQTAVSAKGFVQIFRAVSVLAQHLRPGVAEHVKGQDGDLRLGHDPHEQWEAEAEALGNLPHQGGRASLWRFGTGR